MIIFAALLGLSMFVFSTHTDNLSSPPAKTTKEIYRERGGVNR